MHRIRNYQDSFLRLRVHWSLTILALVLGSLTVASDSVLAQTTADGTIHGRVADSSGAAIVGANITAHSSVVGGSFRAVSDPEGNYRLTDLPQGTDYILEAEISGFEKFVRTGLVVRAGLNVTVDVSLNVGSQSQTVEVSGDAP